MYHQLSQICTSTESLHVAQVQKMHEPIIRVAFQTSMEGRAFRISVEVNMWTIFSWQRTGFSVDKNLGPNPKYFLMQHEETMYHTIHGTAIFSRDSCTECELVMSLTFTTIPCSFWMEIWTQHPDITHYITTYTLYRWWLLLRSIMVRCWW